jgi:hypothetical protein
MCTCRAFDALQNVLIGIQFLLMVRSAEAVKVDLLKSAFFFKVFFFVGLLSGRLQRRL